MCDRGLRSCWLDQRSVYTLNLRGDGMPDSYSGGRGAGTEGRDGGVSAGAERALDQAAAAVTASAPVQLDAELWVAGPPRTATSTSFLTPLNHQFPRHAAPHTSYDVL